MLPKTLKIKPGREEEVKKILTEACAIKMGLGWKGNAEMMVECGIESAVMSKLQLRGNKRVRVKKLTKLIKMSLLQRLGDCLEKP